MDLKENKNIDGDKFRRHPWEIVRSEFILHNLKNIYKNNTKPSSVLDIGSGDAYISKAILDYFPGTKVVSVDTGYESCFTSGRHQVANSLDHIANDKFAVILLLDILEHVKDDQKFLKDIIHRFSYQETFFLITVPLHPFIFSNHDINLGHKRRYTYSELLAKAKSAGLRICYSRYLFSGLLLFRILQLFFGKFINVLKPGQKGTSFTDVATWKHSSLLTTIVNGLVRLDIKCASRLPGLSGYVLASLNHE